MALLSNGAEPQGAPEVVEAHQLLRQQDSILFAGNVEIDIPKAVLMSSYAGFWNVVLKMIEGVGEAAATMIRRLKIEQNPDARLYKQVSRFVKLTIGGSMVVPDFGTRTCCDQGAWSFYIKSDSHAIKLPSELLKEE